MIFDPRLGVVSVEKNSPRPRGLDKSGKWIAVLLSAFMGISFLALAADAQSSVGVYEKSVPFATLESVDIKIKTIYEPRAEKPVDLAFSNIDLGFRIGDNSIEDILEDLGGQTSPSWAASINVRTSVVPHLIRGSTEDELNLRLDEAILQGVADQVDQALAQNQNLNLLSQSEFEQLRQATIAQFFETIELQIEAVRLAKAEEISERLDKIQTETSFQEVALTFAAQVPNGVVFFRGGKFKVHSGPSVSEAGQTKLENVRVSNSVTQRALGTTGTGAVQMSWLTKLTHDLDLRVDVVLFHERLPFISGKHYLAGVVSLSEEDFNRHDNLSDFDSQLLRAILSGENSEFYLTLANHKNGGMAYQVGGMYRLSGNSLVSVDYAEGRKNVLDSGLSVFFVQNLTERLQLYLGYERLKNNYNPLIASGSSEDNMIDTTEWFSGVRYSLVNRSRAKWSVYGQYGKLEGDNDTVSEEWTGWGWEAGTEFRLILGK